MIGIALGLVLVFVIVEDLRRFRIRNLVVLGLAAGFFLACYAEDRLALVVPHLLFALAGLVLLFLAFAARMIGGGDTKLLAVALLWIGPEGAFVFGLALLVCVLAYIVGAKLGWLPSRERRGNTEIPFGPSIATAWIIVIAFSAYLRVFPF